MVFAKNEIIELTGGKKHIIVDFTTYENKYYYYICEIDENERKVIDNFQVITTVKENGVLFIKTINGSLKEVLLSIFSKNLNINQD